jgi:hypothetical protein
MCKSQHRNTKQQGNSSSSKVNSTTKGLNNSKEEKISNIEFQKIIVRVINKPKEETHKLVFELKRIGVNN